MPYTISSVLRKRVYPTPSSFHSATRDLAGAATAPHRTAGMRPPSRWWKNVVEGGWFEGLSHSPELLMSRLHLCESNKLLSYLGHCFVLVWRVVGG